MKNIKTNKMKLKQSFNFFYRNPRKTEKLARNAIKKIPFLAATLPNQGDINQTINKQIIITH